MTTAVFDWVAQRAHGRVLVFLTVLLVACSAWLFWMGQPLATAEAPDGIVSFELAGTVERSAAILQSSVCLSLSFLPFLDIYVCLPLIPPPLHPILALPSLHLSLFPPSPPSVEQ